MTSDAHAPEASASEPGADLSPQAVQIQTTVDSRDAAQGIARSLVGSHVAACVQIVGPITSVYRWQGDVTDDEEWLLLVKTTADGQEAAEQAIRSAHSYDVPEILVFPVVGGGADYLAWVAESTR